MFLAATWPRSLFSLGCCGEPRLGANSRRTPRTLNCRWKASASDLISRGVSTPGVHVSKPDHDTRPGPEDITPFRSAAMRVAYLSLDRPKFAFSVKELGRGMAHPSVEDARGLHRFARFLFHTSRRFQAYPLQCAPTELRIEVGSGFAACCRSDKSTSGFTALEGGIASVPSANTRA